jgi:hypothetical protein
VGTIKDRTKDCSVHLEFQLRCKWSESILTALFPANGGRAAGYYGWCEIIHSGKSAAVSAATHLAV